MPNVIARERLWLTADKKRIVADGHKDAAMLWAAPGDELPEPDARRFGVTDGMAPGRKQAPKPADKEADKPADKGGAPAPAKAGGLKIITRKKGA